VEAAKGRWLAFLDSDDAWAPDKLQKQVALQKERRAKLVYTGSAFMDAEGNRLEWVLHVPTQIGYRKLLKQNLVSNSSVLILKECYQRYEVMGDGMHEDFACWLKLLRSGETAHGIDEPLLIYRLSPSSKSGNKLRAAKMNWNSYRAVGMDVFEASYYMVWYAINGIRKYKHLKKEVSAA
jgi:teichuronic acid biosynthesis glycosyltransferase TuaG